MGGPARGRTGGGKEVLTTAAVAVGVGVGMAALGFAGAALVGAGVLTAAATNSGAANRATRRSKPAVQAADVRRDAEGRIENWPQLLKAVQQGVSWWLGRGVGGRGGWADGRGSGAVGYSLLVAASRPVAPRTA